MVLRNPEDDFVPLLRGAEFPKEQFEESVIEFTPKRTVEAGLPTSGTFAFRVNSFADTIIPWGTNVRGRDIQLRNFWRSEDMLAGAVYSVCTRNAAFEWEIEGPPKTVAATTNMLHNAIAGPSYGWTQFILALSLNLYTQDNGAFIELIRRENRPDSPVVGIANLDSGRCLRTGNPDIPVIYTDLKGKHHKMNWL